MVLIEVFCRSNIISQLLNLRSVPENCTHETRKRCEANYLNTIANYFSRRGPRVQDGNGTERTNTRSDENGENEN